MHLDAFISNLALILVVAGIVTLIFVFLGSKSILVWGPEALRSLWHKGFSVNRRLLTTGPEEGGRRAGRVCLGSGAPCLDSGNGFLSQGTRGLT